MLASNNIMSPATAANCDSKSGYGISCYYLTAENPQWGWGYFASLDDAIMAYEQQSVDLHAFVWVRFDGIVESTLEEFEPLQVDKASDGTVTKLYSERRRRADGNLIAQFIRTTQGGLFITTAIAEVLS